MKFNFQSFSETDKQENQPDIKEQLAQLQIMLESAKNRFSQLSDSDLAEACIFEINSLNARYRYLLKCAKAESA